MSRRCCAISWSVAASQHELPQIFWGKSLNAANAVAAAAEDEAVGCGLLLLLCHATTRHADCLHNLSCAKQLAIALYLRYTYRSTYMHKYSRYSVTTRDTRTMATDERFDEALAACLLLSLGPLAGAIIIRIHGPVRASSIVLKYVHILYSISLWYLSIDISISRRDPSFSYVCMCIYSQRTFVIQFRFVVSSIFKLFQTTLDPASVSVCMCECVCECVWVRFPI